MANPLSPKGIAPSWRTPKTWTCKRCRKVVRMDNRQMPNGWLLTDKGIFCGKCAMGKKI